MATTGILLEGVELRERNQTSEPIFNELEELLNLASKYKVLNSLHELDLSNRKKLVNELTTFRVDENEINC